MTTYTLNSSASHTVDDCSHECSVSLTVRSLESGDESSVVLGLSLQHELKIILIPARYLLRSVKIAELIGRDGRGGDGSHCP